MKSSLGLCNTYEMTPLYDLLSVWPYIGRGRGQLHMRDVRLAMALDAFASTLTYGVAAVPGRATVDVTAASTSDIARYMGCDLHLSASLDDAAHVITLVGATLTRLSARVKSPSMVVATSYSA